MRVEYRIDGSLVGTTEDFYRVVGEAVNGDRYLHVELRLE